MGTNMRSKAPAIMSFAMIFWILLVALTVAHEQIPDGLHGAINIDELFSGQAQVHLADMNQQNLASTVPPCSTVQVVSGDSCATLASKCKISAADLAKFNPNPSFCSTLAVGQYTCCSPGILPDLKPKPNANGDCASYQIQDGDYCAKIAAEHHLTVTDIEAMNPFTWGWVGCSKLRAGQVICLSSGMPPMPVPVPGAVCGPQVPGTRNQTGGVALAFVNPCPLNVCCNSWGQCGTTRDFCTIIKSPTGAPGSAGCISNCGMEMSNNKNPPAEFKRIGYFESWAYKRSCLPHDIATMDLSAYTHIHFAFGSVTSDYQVDVSSVLDQFNKFSGLQQVKKILSFGGWSFSTELDTYPIFREAVSDQDRQRFANNLVNFMNQHGLDGVDFDWEYPGAPDIPGIPPGGPNDGKNYLAFLKLVRAALPASKSVSIAAPASYWYLKGFPIQEIGQVVDYIVYMTYDLHGQWDYGNPYSQDGCPPLDGVAGNCLRSHVNGTETNDALIMITKAGVPANKVVVGVSSYGRSFRMAVPGCDGPMCRFTKEPADALCGTSGYIPNGMIEMIREINPTAKYSKSADSDILVFNNNQWVAYMSYATKKARTQYYKGLNFAGTSDWAIDLEVLTSESCDKYIEAIPKDTWMPFSLVWLQETASTLPPKCVYQFVLALESQTLSEALRGIDKILHGNYDHMFQLYSDLIKKQVPVQLENWMASNASRHFKCKKGAQPIDCPTEVRDIDPADGAHQGSYQFELVDEKGFYDGIMATYGIQKSWVRFGNNFGWVPFPMASDSIAVPNPKSLTAAFTSKYGALSNDLAGVVELAKVERKEKYCFVAYEVMVAISTAYSIWNALESIQQIGEDIEEQETLLLVTKILTITGMVITFGGLWAEVAGAAAEFVSVLTWSSRFVGASEALVEIAARPEGWVVILSNQILPVGPLVTTQKWWDDLKPEIKQGGAFHGMDDEASKLIHDLTALLENAQVCKADRPEAFTP